MLCSLINHIGGLLRLCRKYSTVYFLITYLIITSSQILITVKLLSGICSGDGDLQLVNGNATTGIVEICINSEWRSVCDDYWTDEEAEVVCKQLGHSTAGNALLYLHMLMCIYFCL